jgi:hypothetical protein
MEVFLENFPSIPADLDDFYSKSCIEGQNRKIKSTGKKSVWNHPNIMGVFWAFKSESILPIQILEKNETMFLSDLQTVAFWNLKNERSIAEIDPTKKMGFRLAPLTGTPTIPRFSLSGPSQEYRLKGAITETTPEGGTAIDTRHPQIVQVLYGCLLTAMRNVGPVWS